MKEFHFFEAAWAEILEHLLKAPDGGKINSDAAREYIEEYITKWLLMDFFDRVWDLASLILEWICEALCEVTRGFKEPNL